MFPALLLALALTSGAAAASAAPAAPERETNNLLNDQQRRLQRLFAPAEASARALIAGGKYFIGGGHPGWVSEATGRAGGVYMAAALPSGDRAQPGDVVWIGYSPESYQNDLALARALEARGCVVTVLGPKPPSGVPPVKYWVDSFTPWDARANATLFGNALSLWTLTAEMASAAARQNTTLVFWESIGMPGGRARWEKYKSQKFHREGEPRMRPAAAGALARAYIDSIRRMIAAIGRKEGANVAAVAGEIRKRVAASQLPLMMTTSHMMPHAMTGEGRWYRFQKSPKEFESALASNGYLIFLGYYGPLPADVWDALRRSKARAAWFAIPRPDQKLDFASHGDVFIDQQWQIGDAAVTVPDYDIRILPASGLAQLYIHELLAARLGMQ
ncbi:MAG: hypothetical protein IT158_29100 [Bryobacterales bacterium]|nr:hypothetical protein [Bryobacterales bacterium]